jgi:hypothetical protein
MFNKDERSEAIARLENRFGLTTENAATLYERNQRVEAIRQEAEQLLGHSLPPKFSNGLIEAFYKYAPALVVSMWKAELDKEATPENCTVLLQIETIAHDLRDDTKWFSLVVRQGDDRVIQLLQVKLSPSVGVAQFAGQFEAHFGTDKAIEELRDGKSRALSSFKKAIFEGVMECPSESHLEVVGPGADRWTYTAQRNLKMNLHLGLQEEGGAGWLPKVKADHQRLFAEEDPEDRPQNPSTAILLQRRKVFEEWGALVCQEASAQGIVDALECGLSMSDLLNPQKLYDQLCSAGREQESESKKLVALAYLRQVNPPCKGVAGWIDERIEEERLRVVRRASHFQMVCELDQDPTRKYESRQRLIFSQYVYNALCEHADVLKQELSAGDSV